MDVVKVLVVVVKLGCGGVGPMQTAAEIKKLLQFVKITPTPGNDGIYTVQTAPVEAKYILDS